MARQTRTVRILDEGADDKGAEGETFDVKPLQPGEQDAEQIRTEQDDDVVKALTEIEGAQDARWKVFRVLPTEKAGFLMEIPTAQLSQSYIAKVAGPGKYRVRGISARNRYIGERVFTIAELLHPDAAQQSPFGDINALRELFGVKPSTFDWDAVLKWAAILGPILGPIIIEWFKSRPKTQNTFLEMAQGMKALKDISGDNNPLKQIGQMRDLIGAVQDLAPDKPATGSTWVDLIRDGAQQLPAILAMMSQAKGGIQSPAQAPLSEQPQNAGPQSQGNDPMLQLMMWIRPQLAQLVMKAAKNSDPELYAEVLADNLPPNLPPAQIEAFLMRPDWWQLLCGVDARAAPYQGWFTKLRTTLLEMIEDAKKPPADDAHPDTPENE